jgi:hypothetical protein
MSDPALMVGPLDVDSSTELTERFGVANNALELLRRTSLNMPAELMGILALPPDRDRTEALDADEVDRKAREVLGDSLQQSRDDTLLPNPEYDADAITIHGRYVRGADDRTRVVTVSYTVPSGRTGKAAIGPYKEFTKSVGLYEDSRRVKMGIASLTGDDEGGRSADSPEAEALREEVLRLREELEAARDPEPFEGYGDANANDLKKRLADADRDEAQAIADYERSHENRSTVVDAAVKRVDTIDEEAEAAEREAQEARDAEMAELREQLAELKARADAADGDGK